MPKLRTLLVLGRVSNLPTVWSNCIAASILAGGDDWKLLALTCLGTTFLYVAGMYLNDAFDASFDREFRKERPIPSGAIRENTVWILGSLLMVLGIVVLLISSRATLFSTVLLVLSILLYDAFHKKIRWSPVLMAMCRFFLYMVAASVFAGALNPWVLTAAGAMALYIIGLSFIAKTESTDDFSSGWPILLLVLAPLHPLISGRIFNEPIGWTSIICVTAVSWCRYCLHLAYDKSMRNPHKAVSFLLAGICLMDWTFVPPNSPLFFIFPILFFMALVFQRTIPAT